MKNIYSFLVALLFIFLFVASSSTNNYYQLYTSVPENGEVTGNGIIFEDAKCTVTYDLFDNGGNMGFSIYNKTDSDIVVLVDRSFFVLNGIAYNYYKKEVETKTIESHLSSGTRQYSNNGSITNVYGVGNSSSLATTAEDKLVIPSKTMRYLSKYYVVNTFHVSCNLFKHPSSSRQISKLTFEKNNSPYVFYNIISYRSKGVTSKMENRFFVSEISNLPESKVISYVFRSECSMDRNRKSKEWRVFTNPNPGTFYFKYR